MELQCSKCAQTDPRPSMIYRTCNRHIASEKTGYCQGILYPAAYYSTGSLVIPTTKEKITNQ